MKGYKGVRGSEIAGYRGGGEGGEQQEGTRGI